MRDKLAITLLSGVMALVAVGCSKQGANVAPLEKVPVVQLLTPGEWTAAQPVELAGKPILPSQTASVDAINGAEMDRDLRWYAKVGEGLTISGWAFDKEKPRQKTYIELVGEENRYYANVDTNIARADVVKFYEISNELVGYSLTLPANVKPGSYRIAVLRLGDADVARWESPARLVVDEK